MFHIVQRGVPAALFLIICLQGSLAELVDLTYGFDNMTHYWVSSKTFNLTEEFKGWTDEYWYEANEYRASEHGGTHLDAPCHFFKGGWTADQIPVDRFVANAALVDISERSQKDPDTTLSSADLASWRRQHGVWTYPTIVLVRTGRASLWHDRHLYFGTRPQQPDDRHFPGVGEDAARELAADPTVVGVGIDTPSIDPGVSHNFTAHQILFSQNKFSLENVADMSRVPAVGARVLAMPMKIVGGSGGPCRVLVDVPAEVTTA